MRVAGDGSSVAADTLPAIHRPQPQAGPSFPLSFPDVTVQPPSPTVLLSLEPLPPLVRPAHAYRRDGVTLIWVHPSALRAEMVFWTRDNLTDEERLVLRVAYDLDDNLHAPPLDQLLEGTVSEGPPIPMMLRVPDEAHGAMSA